MLRHKMFSSLTPLQAHMLQFQRKHLCYKRNQEGVMEHNSHQHLCYRRNKVKAIVHNSHQHT